MGINFEKHSSNCRNIKNMFDCLTNDIFKITFCGKFKSGKSSLINAFLDASILPVKTTTATAVITKVFYSDVPTAYVVKDNNRIEISFDDAESYIVAKDKSLDGVTTSGVKEVGIGLPNPMLKGIVITDTPGLDDDDDLTELTLNEIHNTDLAVIVYDANQLLSKNEKETVKDINEILGGNIVFVVNRVDQVTEYSGSISEIKEIADYYLRNFGNYFIGKGRTFYTAAGGNNIDIMNFRNWIMEVINTKSTKDIISRNTRLSIISGHIDDCLSSVNNDISEIEDHISELVRKNELSKTEKENKRRKEFKELKNNLSLFKVKLSDELGSTCLSSCEQLFNNLKSNTGWAGTYSADTKEIAKNYYVNYVSGQKTKLHNTYNFGTINVPQLIVTDIFSYLSFPGAYSYTHSDGWGGAAAGAATGAAIGSIIPGIGTALGAAIGGFIGKKSASGNTPTLNTACVSSSVNYVSQNVVPKLRDRIDNFFRLLNEHLTSYENSLQFKGDHDFQISLREQGLNKLQANRTEIIGYKQKISDMMQD